MSDGGIENKCICFEVIAQTAAIQIGRAYSTEFWSTIIILEWWKPPLKR